MDLNELRKEYRSKVSKADVERAVKIGKRETEPTRRKMFKMMWG